MAWTRNRILRWAVGLLLAVGLYAVLGFWALPHYARGKAIEVVSGSLHRSLSIGQLRFNPFTFELEARDVAMADGSQRLLSAKRLYANFQLSSLWRRAWTFAGISIEQPYANVVIGPDGSLNLAALVPPSDPQEPPSALPALSIDTLTVNGGQVDFSDLRRAAALKTSLSPVEFTLHQFTTVADSGGFQLTAASTQDERFWWKGTLGLAPLRSEGDLRVSGLRASTVVDLVGDLLPFQLADGRLDLQSHYRFSAPANAGTELDLDLPKVTASQLALRARGVEQNWIGLPHVVLEQTHVSLARHAVSIEAVQLQDASAKLWLEPDGRFNLTRMFQADAPAQAAASKPAPPQPATSPDWSFNLGRLQLQAADVDFQDRSVQPVADFHLKLLQLTVLGISQDLSKPLQIEANAALADGGRAQVSGSIVPDSATLDLQAEVAGLPATRLLGYLPHYPALQLKSGQIEAKGRLTLQPDQAPGPRFSFAGQAALLDVGVLEKAGQTAAPNPLLSWQRLAVQGIDFTLAPDALKIARIDARGLQARVMIEPDGSLNLSKALATQQAAAAPATSPPAKGAAASGKSASAGMPIRVAQVMLDNGVMEFADHSIDPNFQARIEALHGSIRGISTASNSVSRIDLKGQVLNRYSPVTIQGGTDLFAFDRHTDITLGFHNIDLPIFNPYSGRFAGYAIAKGKLSTDLHYRIDDRKLQAEHHVVLDQLEWGDATDSKDKVSLPVRLATSLLKDRHGVIDLSLPVAGTLDDPTFRIGPLVWQVIRNVLTKAVTAPFSLLGSLFKGAEQAQFVDFPAGSATLDEASRSSLAALSKGLVERPNLKLEIPAGGASQADAQALAARALERALAGDGGEAVALDGLAPDKQVDALSKLYRQAMGSKPQWPEEVATAGQGEEDASRKDRHAARDASQADWLRQQLLAHYQPSPEALQTLARERADAVQDALLADGQMATERVFIAGGKPAVDHEGKARLELGLQ